MAQLQDPKFLLMAMTVGRRAQTQAVQAVQARQEAAAEEAAREAKKPGHWVSEGEEEAEQEKREREAREEEQRAFNAWG
jgi:hypothetical protein